MPIALHFWRQMSGASVLVLVGGLLAGSAQAQNTGPLILSCSWNSGGTGYLKYETNTLFEWYPDVWAWRPRTCTLFLGDPGRCQAVLGDTHLSFSLRGSSLNGDESGIFSQHIEEGGISISRQDGTAKFYYNHYGRSRLNRGASVQSKTYDQTEVWGKCAKADDPAEQPKPSPPEKAF